MADQKVVVKKVSPYPIPAQVTAGGQPIQGNIVKLTHVGYLMSLSSLALQLGQEYEVNFKIPASDNHILARTKVIKTYDRKFSAGSPPAGESSGEDGAAPSGESGESFTAQERLKMLQTERLVEMHFLSLTEDQKQLIRDFVVRIGQSD